VRFGCCMGLATFVPPSTEKNFWLKKSLSWEEKLDMIPSIMVALERNGFDFVEAEVSLLSPEGDFRKFKAFKEKIRSFPLSPRYSAHLFLQDLK